jgi:hypothetical protein
MLWCAGLGLTFYAVRRALRHENAVDSSGPSRALEEAAANARVMRLIELEKQYNARVMRLIELERRVQATQQAAAGTERELALAREQAKSLRKAKDELQQSLNAALKEQQRLTAQLTARSEESANVRQEHASLARLQRHREIPDFAAPHNLRGDNVLWRDPPPTEAELDRIAQQVCREILQNGGDTHFDLAAANVLVYPHATDPSNLLVRFIDVYSSYFRWMSPELMGQLSEKSTVYAYGVFLWELWSHGDYPWAAFDNSTVRLRVADGERLPQPDDCPQDVYDMMLRCWAADPSSRPSFSELHAELLTRCAASSRTSPCPPQ